MEQKQVDLNSKKSLKDVKLMRLYELCQAISAFVKSISILVLHVIKDFTDTYESDLIATFL